MPRLIPADKRRVERRPYSARVGGNERVRVQVALGSESRYDAAMRTLLTAVTLVVALAALGGCSKCDPWWGEKPASCQSTLPR